MKIHVFSRIGSVRQHNEDSYAFNEERQLFAIADGMGGHLRGEVASGMAIKTVMDQLLLEESKDPQDLQSKMDMAITQANSAVFEFASTHPDHQGMGTTLSMIQIMGSTAVFAHVGDSRIYLFRNQELTRLTKDHTMVEELVDTGTISSEQAKNHPKKNILIRALGTQEELTPDLGQITIQPQDVLVLMTDGVYEYIEEERLASILSEKTFEETDHILDDIVRAGGARDNYTMILVGLEQGEQ